MISAIELIWIVTSLIGIVAKSIIFFWAFKGMVWALDQRDRPNLAFYGVGNCFRLGLYILMYVLFLSAGLLAATIPEPAAVATQEARNIQVVFLMLGNILITLASCVDFIVQYIILRRVKVLHSDD